MSERPIVTTHINASIAIPGYEWEAIREGWDASQPAGYGATEAEAIADLRANEAVAAIKRGADAVMLSPVAMAAAVTVGTCLAGWVS